MAFAILSTGVSPGASSGSCVITKPSGLAVGDIMVAHCSFWADSSGTVTMPSGWTQLQYEFQSPLAGFSAWKIADSSDVAASTFTFSHPSSASRNKGAILRISGGRESSIGYAKDIDSGTATSGVVTVPTITPTVADSLILFFVSHARSSSSASTVSGYAMASDNPSWTEAYDTGFGSTTRAVGVSCAYAVRPQTTATGNNTASVADTGIDAWVGQVVAIQPAIATSVSDIVTATDAMLVDLGIVAADTVTATDEIDTAVAQDWQETEKEDTDWTFTVK